MNDIIEYKSYYAQILFSAEDDVFYGKLIGLNDLVTFEGSTVKELKKSFRTSVDDYLQTCKDLGKDPEKAYKGSFNIRITPDLHRQAAKHATMKNMSLNEFVGFAISSVISKIPKRQANALSLIGFATIALRLIPGFNT